MSEKKNEVQNVEVEALSDDDLESVAGGHSFNASSCCSTTGNACCNSELAR